MNRLTVDLTIPAHLTEADRQQWSQWLALNPVLDSPYCELSYIEALFAVVPQARLARITRHGRTLAFLPFQLRGRVAQPLGAPLTDFHSLITAPDARIDLRTVLRALDLHRFEVSGWLGSDTAFSAGETRERLYADVSGGFDIYYADQRARQKKFFRNAERCRRNLDAAYADLTFDWQTAAPDIIDWVIAHKRDQYARTGLHDVFACGWTREVLYALAHRNGCDLRLMAGVYRNGTDIIAAEIGLSTPQDLHLWFPAYDRSAARHSPGILLSLDIMKAAAAEGVRRVDFGCADEPYKLSMTTHKAACYSGYVLREKTIALPAVLDPYL
ncbi:MAG: GNAT family N-acetyltransferase, partial [Asticcacaulis sp.]